ncbi:MAG: 30S ribosomal protein S4 [Candidatus Micrarchaeia archaeon]
MGAPKRLRKKYEKPTMMWDLHRIEEEHSLKEKYGLKNMRELWLAESELRRIRRKAREVLSGKESDETGKAMIARLSKLNVIKSSAAVDDLLVIGIEALLERRLQSMVLRKGMAKSIKQARQLVTHGFIAIDGKRITSPSYLVSADEENKISYYKPIKIDFGNAATAESAGIKANEGV